MSGKNTFFLEIKAEKQSFFSITRAKKTQKQTIQCFLPTFAAMKTLTDTEYIHALIAIYDKKLR